MKIPRSEYETAGEYPVIDQGKEFSVGFTSERAKLFKGNLPVLLFGDHTRLVKIVESEFALGADGVKALETKPEIAAKFLYYYLLHDPVESRGYSRHFQYLKQKEIPLTPLREQQRIVEILDYADALRRQRREADAISQKILPALFQEMFGDARLNPKSWPLETLGKLGRVVTGSTPPSKKTGMFDGPIPFVTPADLKESWVEHHRSVTAEGAAQSRTVRTGSALVCCIGATIGKMGKARALSAFNQQINSVEWYDESYDSYGLEALKQIKDQIIAASSSTTLPIINKSTFQALMIPCPPKTLRLEFAERVAKIENTTNKQNTTLETLEKLFIEILNQAFDGRLTAQWRENQANELIQEMALQTP